MLYLKYVSMKNVKWSNKKSKKATPPSRKRYGTTSNGNIINAQYNHLN